MTSGADNAQQASFSSRGVARLSYAMLLILGVIAFAALAFGEMVIAGFRALPGSEWLFLVAASNDAILRDANMAWQAQVVCAFRLAALTTLPPLLVVYFVALLRAQPKPSREAGARLMWYLPVAVVALWYGLFFDNVFFLYYDEFYAPPETFFDTGKGPTTILIVVGCATVAGAFLLPLLAAVAVHLTRSTEPDRDAKSP
jgi:hypothetical protein